MVTKCILQTMAYDAEILAVPTIRWLGVFLSDVGTFDLPESCLLQLSKRGEHSTSKGSQRVCRYSYLEATVKLDCKLLLIDFFVFTDFRKCCSSEVYDWDVKYNNADP